MRSILLSRACVALFAVALLPTAALAQWSGDPYLLPNDPVTGDALAEVEEPVVIEHEGREFRFGSQNSADTFKAHPGEYIPAVDAAMIEQQLPLYPLEQCPIGGKLGSMGKPIDLIYKNRLVRFCCAGCIGKFKKDPAATIEKLDAAVIEAQTPLYADATCPVSDKKLGSMGDPINKVYGNRLVQFCCNGCVGSFEANPQAYLDKLPEVPHAEHPEGEGHGGEAGHEGHGNHEGHRDQEGQGQGRHEGHGDHDH